MKLEEEEEKLEARRRVEVDDARQGSCSICFLAAA